MGKKFIFIFLLSLCAQIHAKVLLWDLGGVLFEPDKLGVAKEIGLSYFASYMLSDWRTPNIQNLLFEVLEQMERPEQGYQGKSWYGRGNTTSYYHVPLASGNNQGP